MSLSIRGLIVLVFVTCTNDSEHRAEVLAVSEGVVAQMAENTNNGSVSRGLLPLFSPNALEGNFGAPEILPTMNGAESVAIADMDQDGMLDLIVGERAALHVLYNIDGRRFERSMIALPSLPFGLAIGDLNADGWQDVVVAHDYTNTVSVLYGSKSGLQKPVQWPTGRGPLSVVLGDVDGDKRLDIVVGNGSDNVVTLLRANARGGFVASALDGFKQPSSPLLVDLDDDGDLDLLAQWFPGLVARMNLGHGAFAPAETWPVMGTYGDVIAADLDGDRPVDVIATPFASGDATVVFQSGTGRRARDLPIGAGSNAIVAADLNGDGFTDLAMSDQSGFVHVLLNDGHAHFTKTLKLATNDQPAGLAAGDVDGDGFVDLFTVDLNRLQVFWGRGQKGVGVAGCVPQGGVCEKGMRCCSSSSCSSGLCL
jgi:hypothetical protein